MPDTNNEAKPLAEQKMRSEPLPMLDTQSSGLRGWATDLMEGIRIWRVWIRLSVMDVSSEHRRFLLGPLWVPLGLAIFVFALGYVYSYLRSASYATFTMYLAASMPCWIIIQSSIMQGMGVFVSARNSIENIRLPFHYYVFKTVFGIYYTSFLTVPVYLLCLALFPTRPTDSIIVILPAIFIFMITSFAVVICIGMVNLRVRDIATPLSNFMRLMFLVTPVIWMVEMRADSRRAAFVEYNPFYHYIEILRAPLLGYWPDIQNWLVVGVCTSVLLLIATIAMIKFRSRIYYWI